MKILSVKQLHQWDAYTIKKEGLQSLDLMERVAIECVGWIKRNGYFYRSISVFCGKGNNGADGLAISRLLILEGLVPVVYILEAGQNSSDEFLANLKRLEEVGAQIHFLSAAASFPVIPETELVIDALFGIGLNRALQPLTVALIQHINQSGAKVIAIDVPSGMFVDKSCKNQPVIKANVTLTFQCLKRCFLMAENVEYFAQVIILDIGMENTFLADIETDYSFTTESHIAQLIKHRKPFAHKGNHGHALLIAGNRGKVGAAVLATKSCLRAGAGLVTVNIPDEYASVFHQSIPEAMVIAREANMQFLNVYKSIGIGPGVGLDDASGKMLQHIFTHYSNPMVIDADAITILSKHTDWLKDIPAGSILAPHPKEFDRLFGFSENEYERIEKAMAFSKKYPFVIVLKGHYSLVIANGKGWYNNTGNAGMAKGGTGDILTGILTAFLAQGYLPLHAAMLGVYLHGLAADLALENQSMESLLATDIIEKIGAAFKKTY